MSPSPTDFTERADLESLMRAPAGRGSQAGAPATTEPSRWFLAALLGLALLMGLLAIRDRWVPNKWLFGDGAFYMNVSRGLLENHSLRQETMHPHSWYERDLGWNRDVDAAWSNIALGRHGEWWPKHPILLPVVAAPLVWALGPVGTLIFQFLAWLAVVALAYRVAARLVSRPASLVAACAFVVTPWVAERVWGFNNDVFYTALLLAALDAALGAKAAASGLLLGLAVLAKPTNVLYGPGIALLFLLRKDFRGALRLCLFAAGPTLLALGLNWYLYGSPIRTGYDRILVRVGGEVATHSHSADFHLSQLRPGLSRALFGGDGFLGRFPLMFPAVAGWVLLFFRRRWREALALGWCVAVPIAFHAPYAWYRLEFNLPQVALGVALLAALLPPFKGPFAGETAPARVHWGRLVAVAAAVGLLGIGFGRRALAHEPEYLWRELPRAEVFLGDIPCDYYNNQMERWECSHFDSNDWFMTGRPLAPELRFAGRKEDLLLFHPHPSGRERRLEYPAVPMGKTLHLRYGLADNARADAKVHFKVLAEGALLLEEEVSGRGLLEKDLDTSALAGRSARLVLSVSAADTNLCIFAVNGSPR
jgi:hypothetical protein